MSHCRRYDRNPAARAIRVPAPRSSGVRAASGSPSREGFRDAPTARPPRKAGADRRPSAPIRALLDRFAAGNHREALAGIQALFDRSPVPTIVVCPEGMDRAQLDRRTTMLLSRVDSRAPLEVVFELSSLGLLEGLEALCELLDRGLVSLSLE